MRLPKPMTMLAVAPLILIAGCQTTVTAGTEVCSHWRSISWSKADTVQTIDEIKGNNARRKAWCQT